MKKESEADLFEMIFFSQYMVSVLEVRGFLIFSKFFVIMSWRVAWKDKRIK